MPFSKNMDQWAGVHHVLGTHMFSKNNNFVTENLQIFKQFKILDVCKGSWLQYHEEIRNNFLSCGLHNRHNSLDTVSELCENYELQKSINCCQLQSHKLSMCACMHAHARAHARTHTHTHSVALNISSRLFWQILHCDLHCHAYKTQTGKNSHAIILLHKMHFISNLLPYWMNS